MDSEDIALIGLVTKMMDVSENIFLNLVDRPELPGNPETLKEKAELASELVATMCQGIKDKLE